MTGPGAADPRLPFERAVERLAAVVGEDSAAAVREAHARAVAAGDPDRVAVPVGLTWGWLLDRPGLGRRERVVAMLAVDIARGSRNALRDHVRLALVEGITGTELRELLVQLGPYAGYPVVNDATGVLLDELSVAAQPGRTAGPEPPARAGWFDRPASMERVSLVVPDARAAAEELAALLGVVSWEVTRLDDGVAEFAADGVAQTYAMLRAVGSTASGVRFELLEPHSGPPPWHLQLLGQGAGIAAFTVGEADEAGWAALRRRAASAGVATTCSLTAKGGAAMHVLDTRGLLGGYRIAVASPSVAVLDAQLGVDETWELSCPDGPLLPVGPLDHAAVVVHDVAARTAAHARVFGRRRWPLLTFDSAAGTLSDTRYDGVPAPDAYLSSVARVGGFRMEVIQPVGGPSRYREGYLQPRGEGAQHLFLGPLAGAGEWDVVVERLAERGRSLVTEGTGWAGAARYGYVDTLGLLGCDVELVYLRPGAVLDPRQAAAFVFDHPGAGP